MFIQRKLRSQGSQGTALTEGALDNGKECRRGDLITRLSWDDEVGIAAASTMSCLTPDSNRDQCRRRPRPINRADLRLEHPRS
jgi:hypothetical protein